MRLDSPAACPAHEGEGIDHRAAADLEVEVVKGAQHALGVRDGRRRVARPRWGLARQRVRRRSLPAQRWALGPAPVRTLRLRRRRQPAAEVAALELRRLCPVDPERREEAEPAQKVHPIGALSRRRPSTGGELGEVHRSRWDRGASGVEEAVGLEEVPCRCKRAHLGHQEVVQISRSIVRVEHRVAR